MEKYFTQTKSYVMLCLHCHFSGETFFFFNFLILASGLKGEGKKDKGMALLPTTGKWGVVPPSSLTSSRFPELSGSFHLGILLNAHTVVFRQRIRGYNGSIVVGHHHL